MIVETSVQPFISKAKVVSFPTLSSEKKWSRGHNGGERSISRRSFDHSRWRLVTPCCAALCWGLHVGSHRVFDVCISSVHSLFQLSSFVNVNVQSSTPHVFARENMPELRDRYQQTDTAPFRRCTPCINILSRPPHQPAADSGDPEEDFSFCD